MGWDATYPGTENIWQSYCMSLGCDELMGWYDMGCKEGRVGMVWYGMVVEVEGDG